MTLHNKTPITTSEVKLHKHPCNIYNFWSQYLQNKAPSAVCELTPNFFHNFNPTARNRYYFAKRRGYTARELTWPERNQYLDDIYEVNTSKEMRQHRPMKESYRARPVAITTPDQCPQHFATFIGVFAPPENNAPSKLVGYITTNFCGNLAASSQIIGHGQHLNNGIMLLLWATFAEVCLARGVTHMVYSRWSDGHDGLRYWKYSVGLKPIILVEQNYSFSPS